VIKGWHIATVAVIAGIIVLFYVGLRLDPRSIPTVLIGSPAPRFSGPEVHSGETLALDQYRGKVVVVNFWASWCQECRLEHENLIALYRQFQGNPNFAMVGIDYQDKSEDAKGFLQEFGDAYLHVQDPKGKIAIDFGVYGVPETFVIDPVGVIRYKQVGPIVGSAYSNLADKVLTPLLIGKAPLTS
jgi:cytochrome c biogenesis protein CcmG/thiol:disulfide interchange protein DsbE